MAKLFFQAFHQTPQVFSQTIHQILFQGPLLSKTFNQILFYGQPILSDTSSSKVSFCIYIQLGKQVISFILWLMALRVGAFYPFSRDHSDKNSPSQELFLWESVARTAKKALGLLYPVLPYYTHSCTKHTSIVPPWQGHSSSPFTDDGQKHGISIQFVGRRQG